MSDHALKNVIGLTLDCWNLLNDTRGIDQNSNLRPIFDLPNGERPARAALHTNRSKFEYSGVDMGVNLSSIGGRVGVYV